MAEEVRTVCAHSKKYVCKAMGSRRDGIKSYVSQFESDLLPTFIRKNDNFNG